MDRGVHDEHLRHFRLKSQVHPTWQHFPAGLNRSSMHQRLAADNICQIQNIVHCEFIERDCATRQHGGNAGDLGELEQRC